MQTLELRIDNMHCGGCAANVKRILQAITGVEVIDVAVRSATLRLDPAQTPPQRVVEQLHAAGFPARFDSSVATSQPTDQDSKCHTPSACCSAACCR